MRAATSKSLWLLGFGVAIGGVRAGGTTPPQAHQEDSCGPGGDDNIRRLEIGTLQICDEPHILAADPDDKDTTGARLDHDHAFTRTHWQDLHYRQRRVLAGQAEAATREIQHSEQDDDDQSQRHHDPEQLAGKRRRRSGHGRVRLWRRCPQVRACQGRQRGECGANQGAQAWSRHGRRGREGGWEPPP